jgi:hypothetical protein
MISLLGQQTPAADELYDIVVLEPVPPIGPLVFWSIIGVLLFALIAVAIWYFLKRKMQSTARSAATKVLTRLREIERGIGVLEPNQVSLAISDALKDYMREKFNDPVRYETAQEFLKRNSNAKSQLPASAQRPLQLFLSESEEVKFGNPADGETKLLPLLKRADEIITVCEHVSEPKSEI